MYQRNPAVRSVSAVSPDRRMDPQSWQPWLKQAARPQSYKPIVEAVKTAVPMRPQSPPPRMTYTNALCAEIRPDPRATLSPIHQRNAGQPQAQVPVTQVPAQMPPQNVNYFEKQIPQQQQQQQLQPPVAFDEAMTARPGMGRRLEWQVDSQAAPLQGAGSMSAADAGSQPTSCHIPLMSPMQRYRRESGRPTELEPTGTPQTHVKRGNSEGSLPSSARREKIEPAFDLEKKIVEEVNRVLESRLAAKDKEDSEALKKELEKADALLFFYQMFLSHYNTSMLESSCLLHGLPVGHGRQRDRSPAGGHLREA